MSTAPTSDPMGDYQRAVQRICFAPAVPADALQIAGGDAARWAQYRDMVRRRLLRTLREGAPRCCALIGDDRLEAAHARFLASHATRSRFLRDVLLEFAAFARVDAELGLTGVERDLLAFEEAMSMARDALDPPACAGFDFDAEPVVAPSVQLVSLHHAVQTPAATYDALDAASLVVVWRRPTDLAIRWWQPAALEGAWLVAWQRGGGSAMDLAVAAATERGVAVDEAFVDRIATFAGSAIERGVVVGSRATT